LDRRETPQVTQPVQRFTKRERAQLRELAGAAWEAELEAELEKLFEAFLKWADNWMGAFDLSDRIHEFHNGISRELYGRYTGLDPEITVPRAVALGILGEGELDEALLGKLSAQIEAYRIRLEDEDE
jgi:hypothetical protein